jgi:hypothetical protein
MFQPKQWNHAVVQRERRGLRVTVSRPRHRVADVFGLAAMAAMVLFMGYGLFNIFFVPAPQIASLEDFLWRVLPALAFGIPLVFTFRRFFEREFATQTVTVEVGRITWARKTRLWTRTRRLSVGKVTDIAARTDWAGFGNVYVTTKWRRRLVLEDLLADDAVRLARELKQAVGERN